MNLKSKAITGAKWSTISMILVTMLQLGQLTVLARFVQPEEFGLMAIIMVVISFSQSFMDMGISNAIIQRQVISHIQLSSLYWLNILSGVILFLILLSITPIIVTFYDEPKIEHPLMLLSTIFIIMSIGSQYKTLCQKELQFDRIAKCELTAAFCAFSVAVTSAIHGMGIYSLIYGSLTQASVMSILFLSIGLRKHHRPALIYKHSELQGFYSFGLYQMGARSINFISANIDKILIGKMLGMQQVGFYNMAWQLIMFPLSKINPVVNNIAFPIYSKVQEDEETLSKYYSITVKTLSIVTIPLLAYLYFYSNEVVLFAFGSGWEVTANLIATLSFVGILKALANPGGAILLAKGYVKVDFWWNIIWSIILALSIYITLLVTPMVESVPMIILGISLSFGVIWHYIICKYGKIKYRTITIHFLKIIIVCFCIAGFSKVFLDLIDINTAFYRLLIAGAICLSLYAGYLVKFESETFKNIRKGK